MENSAACRILVVSSTTAQAQQFVQRVKSIVAERNSVAVPVPEADSAAAFTHTKDVGSSSIPWTIANKYYTADVHFEMREYEDFAGYHASEVPAFVYVWSRGDRYKEQILALADKLQHYDPEVSLAVQLNITEQSVVYEKDEEDSLDAFLSEHGFEYIDGDRGGRRPTEDGGSLSDEDSSGVPGLPRVIDALSTIMWPSLVQSAATSTRKSRARELLDWAREEEEEDGLRALVPHTEGDSAESASVNGVTKKSRMQREMEELERWLEEEDAGRRSMDDAAAWGAPALTMGDADAWADVPTPLVRTPGAGKESFGFEDDFAEFVGAPVEVSYDHRDEGGGDRLSAQHTGASYHSLASGSEYGGEGIFGEEGDPDLPSRMEVKETSRRIFGTSLDVPRAGASRSPGRAKEGAPLPGSDFSAQYEGQCGEDVQERDHGDVAYQPLDDDSFSMNHDPDDDDYELGTFDLSRVLGALQNMKEEIAGMQDEGERRRAAARVALGLVYGLQKEEERVQEGDMH